MALPGTIDKSTPANTDSPEQGDDQFRALKTFIEDVFGIPDATSITAAAFSISAAGVVTVSQAGMVTKDINMTQGTITADAPQLDGTVTWNAAGVTFTAWKLNVTNTASATASLLIDLQVGGTSQFKVTRAGAATFVGGITSDGHLLWTTDNTYDIGASGATRPRSLFLGTNITVGSSILGTYTIGGTPTLGANLVAGSTYNLGTALAPLGTGFFTLLDLEPSTATTGIIKWNGTNFIHTYGTLSMFIGASAGNFTHTSVQGENYGIGDGALASLTTGSGNIGMGHNNLNGVTSGGFNTALGGSVLVSLTTGGQNTCVGYNCSNSLTGSDNTGMGHAAGIWATSGSSNTYLGAESFASVVGATGTGANNTVVGFQSLSRATSAGENSGVGSGIFSALTTGGENTALGAYVLAAAVTSSFNVGVGSRALQNVTSSDNTAVGSYSLRVATSGTRNTGLGFETGYDAASTSDVTTGSDNTFLGYRARFGSATQRDFAVAIGSGALVDASNTMVLGGTGSATVVVVVGAVAADSNVGQGGLYLNQLAIDTQILAFASTDVVHALTTGGFTAAGTNTFAAFLKQSATEGGLHLAVVAEDGGSSNRVLQISAAGGTPDATDTSGSYGLVHITVAEHDAANAFANSATGANIFTVAGRTAGAEATRFLIKANGDVHVTNTTLVALDDVPDALVMRAGRAAMAPKGHWLHEEFKDLIHQYKHVLEDNRIMFFEPDGKGAMQNIVPSIMFAWDGLYQAHRERAELRSRIERLERFLEV